MSANKNKQKAPKKPNIFVTTGSSPLDFDILIKKIDEINKFKKYNLIIQIGIGKYIPKNTIEYFKFTNNINKYYNWADVIITHTGAGTIFELLEKNKKIIVVPNPKATDNHELANNLSKKGYLKFISYNNLDELDKEIQDILSNKISFKKYKKEKQEIGKEILKFINK